MASYVYVKNPNGTTYVYENVLVSSNPVHWKLFQQRVKQLLQVK